MPKQKKAEINNPEPEPSISVPRKQITRKTKNPNNFSRMSPEQQLRIKKLCARAKSASWSKKTPEEKEAIIEKIRKGVKAAFLRKKDLPITPEQQAQKAISIEKRIKNWENKPSEFKIAFSEKCRQAALKRQETKRQKIEAQKEVLAEQRRKELEEAIEKFRIKFEASNEPLPIQQSETLEKDSLTQLVQPITITLDSSSEDTEVLYPNENDQLETLEKDSLTQLVQPITITLDSSSEDTEVLYPIKNDQKFQEQQNELQRKKAKEEAIENFRLKLKVSSRLRPVQQPSPMQAEKKDRLSVTEECPVITSILLSKKSTLQRGDFVEPLDLTTKKKQPFAEPEKSTLQRGDSMKPLDLTTRKKQPFAEPEESPHISAFSH